MIKGWRLLIFHAPNNLASLLGTLPAKASPESNNLPSMGGRQIPNHRISKEKNREVSSFESTLDSIKRHISISGARRRSRPGSETATNILQVGPLLVEVRREKY
jgi:hypothetical protein